MLDSHGVEWIVFLNILGFILTGYRLCHRRNRFGRLGWDDVWVFVASPFVFASFAFYIWYIRLRLEGIDWVKFMRGIS